MNIDFANLGMPVFTGRERGKKARAQFKLDNIDTQEEVVNLDIPDEVYSVTSSYFLGFFGDSVRTLGREGFKKKYVFKAPKHISDKLEDWITRALRDKSNLLKGVGNE